MSAAVTFELDVLDDLLAALSERGHTLIGPTVRQGAVVYGEIGSAADLPRGVTDEQEPGRYRLGADGGAALFAHNVGPSSWKSHLFPPSLRLWSSRRDGQGELRVEEEPLDERRLAFIGVRACDLQAILVQDRTFLDGAHRDRDYEARRRGCFIVAVNCERSASTCFCVSMGTGPRAEAGFDVALTEIVDAGGHRFLAEPGSERGADLLGALSTRPADGADERAAEAATERAAAGQDRALDTDGIKELLYANLEHPRWDEVADRCLSCGNCTQVCPTCFCTTVDDVTDLTGSEAEHVRRWDSCFSLEHSYIHGGSVRASVRSRYRQWMTHKLATWIDQFGTSGCVGCGRCITWCPVGIDITEEAAAIRATDLREGLEHADA
ncbi:MAG: 4Fe-4S dicluster domain-containing protein [Thermoleophilaceae bacterium]|nr:4Fe-4S dicluster domain-containing protein [Thermoleophilaceae bacterium]